MIDEETYKQQMRANRANERFGRPTSVMADLCTSSLRVNARSKYYGKNR